MHSVWLTLVSSALLCKASRKCIYVPAGSVVALFEEIDDQVNEYGQMVQQVKAGFIDAQDVVSVEATFILPTKLPQGRAGNYHMDSDPQNLVYRVTIREQSNPGYPQADFGHQITTFQPQPLEENDEEGSLEEESTILMDDNTCTTESNIAAEMSILDSYVREICSPRSSVDSFPLAIRQESVWLNALDIDEPTGTRIHSSPLAWLDLATTDDIISSTRELLDAAESLIDEPKDTMVLEPSSVDHEYVAERHPDVQEQTASQNQRSWGDSIDLDAAFGGSATDLAEDFPDPDHLQYQDSPLNKSQWGDIKDLDGASSGIATDLEYQAKSQDDSKWEDVIDLEAAFGGGATDLEEEFEDVNSQAAAICVTAASLMEEEDTGFKSPNLRQHIPDDIEERINYICQTRFSDGDGHVVAGGWALAKACAQWEYMSEAARENKRLGLFKRQGKIPEEVSKSCATSWEKEEWPAGNKPSARPLATLDETAPGPCHHINFLGDPCDTRSNTPPEDSFWAVITSYNRFHHHEKFSRQGVIIAQANKLVDPFEFDPAACDLGQLAGSKLRDAAVGKVRKVYLDCGTWVEDVYSTKDHVPVPLSYESMMSEFIYWKGTYMRYSLQQPHRINNLLDLDDLVVNKGEIIPPKRHYREPNDLFLPSPSKLSTMELVEDEEPEARPMIPYIRDMRSLSRAESTGELQKVRLAAAADRALDRGRESQGHKKGRDGQMNSRLGIELDEDEESLTSSERDKQTSESEVEKANEELQQVLGSVAAAPSASPSSSELEDSSTSLCQSRGKLSSVSTSSEVVELTALEEVKLDSEIDEMLGQLSQLSQLSQLQADQKEEDVRDFVNSLPSPILRFDVLLGDRHNNHNNNNNNEEEDDRLGLGLEEIVRRPPPEKKADCSNLPQEECVDKKGEGLLVNEIENGPSPEKGYAELTQQYYPDPQPPKEKKLAVVVENPSQPEYVSLAKIRALEAVLMQEFDFSKKIEIPYSDVSEIPLRKGDNDNKLYGPISIAIGRKALEVTDWVRSWIW